MVDRFVKRKSQLIENLIDGAFARGYMYGSPETYQVKKLLEKGGEWPESLKPGYMITSLPAEQRKVLETVTTKDFDHRVDSIPWLGFRRNSS